MSECKRQLVALHLPDCFEVHLTQMNYYKKSGNEKLVPEAFFSVESKDTTDTYYDAYKLILNISSGSVLLIDNPLQGASTLRLLNSKATKPKMRNWLSKHNILILI